MSSTHKSKYFTYIDAGIWELKHDLEVNIGPFSSVSLKAGHRTNFGSIPTWPPMLMTMPILGRLFRFFDPRRLVDPDADDIAIPAAIHDGLVGEFSPIVSITHRPSDPEGFTLYTLPNWARSASAMKKAMFGFRAPPWKRFVVYWSVRIYGMYRDRF